MAPKETPKTRKSKRAFRPALDEFLEKTDLPLFTKARAPTLDELPNDCLEGWLVLYEYPSRLGTSFP